MTTKVPPPPDAKDVRIMPPTDGSAFGAHPMGGGSLVEIHDTNPGHIQLPYHIKESADRAVKDVQLQKFINHATLTKDQSRKKICLEVFGENYDRMKELAGSIKQHTLDHLDHYIEKFVDAAEANGSHVHFAETTEIANQICLDIAKRAGSKLCVKTKSMVTEETHLLPELQANGIQTVETDLGEYILQLDHDWPSHIVQPMIHKDRSATARAFTRELGVGYTEDPEKLCQIARNILRDKYRQADLGVSGANFLVAETGSLVLVTNEGNAGLCTSSPKVHIAFVGIEKLIPNLEHLSVLLKLLSRSATGQALTVYTDIITGPRRATDKSGPEELHIILVDNGRIEILKKETREMLRCIRCGACLNACPVYRKIGGHAYGSVYSGPIGAILTPMMKGLANYKDLPKASSLCGACYEACPVKINIPHFLIKLRNEMIGQNITSTSDKIGYVLWAKALSNPTTYQLSNYFQRVAFRFKAGLDGTLPSGGDPYASRGWISNLPGPVAGWTNERDMPTPPARNFRQWWAEHEKTKGN